MSLDAPSLPAYPSPRSKRLWRVWCDWCEAWHTHGEERRRIAHLRERRHAYESAVYERIATLEARERLLLAAVTASESQLAERLCELDDTTNGSGLAAGLTQAGLLYIDDDGEAAS